MGYVKISGFDFNLQNDDGRCDSNTDQKNDGDDME